MDHGTVEESSGSDDIADEHDCHEGQLGSESTIKNCGRSIQNLTNERRECPKPRIPRAQESNPSTAKLVSPALCLQPVSQTQQPDAEENKREDDEYAGAGTIQKQIMVGDEEAMKNYYLTRFKQIQQVPCKSIAKAWIKLIEPKKQVKHPYNGGKKARSMGIMKNGGELTRPDWWPKRGCPHKEPDHQKKERKRNNFSVRSPLLIFRQARLNLLLHMLRDLTNGRVGRDGQEVTVDQLQKNAEERISITLPDREPQRQQRKGKATPRTQRKQGKSQPLSKPVPTIMCDPSQQSHPESLISPGSQPSLRDYKQASTFSNDPTTLQMSGGQPQSEDGIGTSFGIARTLPDRPPFSEMNIDFSRYYGPPISSPVVHPLYSADLTQQGGGSYTFSAKGPPQSLQELEVLQRACTLGVSQMYLQTPTQDTSWQSPSFPQAGQDLANWDFASTPYIPQNVTQIPHTLPGPIIDTQQYMSPPVQEMSHPYPKDLTLQSPPMTLKPQLPSNQFQFASISQPAHGLPNQYRAHAQPGYYQEQ
ncbi:MAG: hypothetical protein Q9187_002160 [Circinaria calcarea]